jgi:hypothetical protein
MGKVHLSGVQLPEDRPLHETAWRRSMFKYDITMRPAELRKPPLMTPPPMLNDSMTWRIHYVGKRRTYTPIIRRVPNLISLTLAIALLDFMPWSSVARR